ncbi:amino acid adenylation domain-containing protein [Mycobacterium sp. NPDC048908]|uniref:amino acid adenylation domain-containing protein n=1 Tax=Mycobacterium sp. NPDC048908 TaxID=3364292 RepID=UPI0037101F2A
MEIRLELLRRRLQERGLRQDGQPAQVATELSDRQRRMWFVHTADPTGALLNVCVSYRITGDIDVARLHDAVNAVAKRHSVLRTTYRQDSSGEPQPTIHDDLTPRWAEHDLSQLSEHARALRLEVLARREFATPFDLTVDAPLRITMLRTSATEHVMLLVAHHIAWDDGSWRVFFADLTAAYAGEELAPAVPSVGVGPDTAAADLEYWRSELANPPEPLELPGDAGSAVPTNWRAQRTTLRLNTETVECVAALAREVGATPYMVLLAAFGALVHRYTHADDFLVAAPVLSRDAGVDDCIGYYGNTVALRLRPQPAQTFRELVSATRDTAVGAFAHQRVNLDRVVREINPDRRHGVERLARLSFGAREADGGGFRAPGVTCERAGLRGQFSQLPLGLMVEFDHLGAQVEAEHLAEILDASLTRQLLNHFSVLLDAAVTAPHQPLRDLPLMGSDDADWLRRVSAGEEFRGPAATLPAVVEAQAVRTPDAVAVVHGDRRYSYREINAAANRFAHWLIGQGIGTEDRVAVLLDKSPDLVIIALGILKAGAVYLPIDPTYPDDRLDFILADSDPKLILREPVTNMGGRDVNPTDADRVRPLRPDNAAYLIYTSGSTGLPKGVPVSHRPVVEFFQWFRDEYQIDESERLLQVSSPSFDVSIAEIFGMLACGARLVIPRADGLRDIGYLTELLHVEGITSMHFVPSLLSLFLSLPGVHRWRTLKRVPIGGEALPGEIADKFHAIFDALLHNFYGPTETVINASRYKVEGKQGHRTVPIGRPKINTQIHLLDDALRPVPVGVIGEIYIGGGHLARGYHRKPALTAERFVADPFTCGGRLYRSGDLARRNADGDIEFVGRADDQVKIRGFRIELGEVAAAIAVDPSVGQAVVVVTDLPGIGKSLVGYLTPAVGADSVDVERVRARVATALPDYMTPAGYVVLDEIPITAHGKIDRAALPTPEIASHRTFREPTAGTERALAELFADLLGRGGVGADDSFFDLGGHSLLATKLATAIRSRCGVDLSVREIFELGTVAQLARRIDAATPCDTARPPLVRTEHRGPRQMSASQLRIWFQYRIDGPSAVNNIPFAARLTGPCDVDALMAAVSDVVDRHEILRTTYREIDGVPHQVVNPPTGVPVRRARGGDEVWLQAELDGERWHTFDLEHEPPVRAAVLTTPEHHVLSLVVHHIAADHWSAGVLFTELLTAYHARRAGRPPALAPLPVQYADYAAWQAAQLSADTGIAAAQRDYWKQQLNGMPHDVGLSPDFERPPVLSGTGDSVQFTIGAQTRAKLVDLTRELGVTEFMLLQTAVAVLLHKAGEGDDIPLGTPVAGRTEAELDSLIGFFVNILVLRNDLRGNPTVREALGRARDTALQAYAHQDLPFDWMVDAVSPARTLSRNPLFSVVVHVREALPADQTIDGHTSFTVLEPTFDVAHADLSLNFFAAGDGYRGHVIYRRELYRRSTIERLARWLGRVLDAIADNADQTLREIQIADDDESGRIARYSTGVATVHVLDDQRQPVPVGVVGDVYYSGAAFDSPMHRSGERARWTEDGRLEFVGRLEQSVTPRLADATGAEPPQTDTEKTVAAMLAEVLGAGEVTRYDDFFDLGGDSILAVQLAARARDRGLALTARMVFEHPSVHDLAAAVDGAGGAPGDVGTADDRHEPMTASGLSQEELATVTALWTSAREGAP